METLKRVRVEPVEIPKGMLKVMNMPDTWKAIAARCEWPEIIALSRTCQLIQRVLADDVERVLKLLTVEYQAIFTWKCNCRHAKRNDWRGMHLVSEVCRGNGKKKGSMIWPKNAETYRVMIWPAVFKKPFEDWGAMTLRDVAYLIDCHTEEGVDDQLKWGTRLAKALGNPWVRHARSSEIIKCHMVREWKR